jgi:hypothetical protein
MFQPWMRRIGVVALWAACGLWARPAAAQTTPSPAPTPSPASSPSPAPAPSDPCGSIISIVSRPTVTTSICTARNHHALVENGYTNTVTTGAGGGNTANYPQSYVQFPTWNPHLEFDFTPASINASSVGGASITGSSDMAFGAKYELGYSARWLYGVNAFFTIPSGSPAFTAGKSEYVGNFNWSYTVSPAIAVAGTLGFNSLSGINSAGAYQPYFAVIPSLEISATLHDGSELLGEYVYYSKTAPDLGGKNLFDFAYVRDFGPHVQFDVEYGFSPTPLLGQRQHYAGVGLSFMN